MINRTQILAKLEELPIEELANETGFSVHANPRLSARLFVMGFFAMASKGKTTLKCWAIEVSKLVHRVFPSSAISSKLQYRHLGFVEALLKHVLDKQIYQAGISKLLQSDLLVPFNRVLIEDSMCVALPANLASVLPGSHSKLGKAATGRIQCRIDLKSNTITNLEVQSYRDNDQKYSPHILHSLQANDLVVRDLGYWKLAVFRLIALLQAFYLSRYHFGINVYNVDTEEQIDLVKQLGKAKKRGQTVVELQVYLGKKEMLPVRLVAIKVPQAVEQQRLRKIAKRKDKRFNPSKEYLALQAWTILITNVPSTVWQPKQLLQVYGFRWRIEIVFKTWKSQLNFQTFFKTKQCLSPPRALITFYLLLIWITLFFVRLYNFFFVAVFELKEKFVSLLKFADFFKDHFGQLIGCPDWDFLVNLVAQHCVYDKRKKLPNFCESFYLSRFNE